MPRARGRGGRSQQVAHSWVHRVPALRALPPRPHWAIVTLWENGTRLKGLWHERERSGANFPQTLCSPWVAA